MRTRRTFLTILAAWAATSLAGPVAAQALPKPFVAYDDELKNGWQNYSWAKVALSTPAGGSKPIKVEGEPWTGLLLHHDSFSTAGFSKLVFYINGGVQGGQRLMVKAMADGKALDASFVIEPKTKTWTVVEVPLKDIGAQDRKIDGIMWQAHESAYSAYYITRIQLE